MHRFSILLIVSLAFCGAKTSVAEDTVEFLSGAKVRGTVKALREADREIDFVSRIGTRTFTRTYSYDRVHAVTMKGRRIVLTEKDGSTKTSTTGRRSSGQTSSNAAPRVRSETEIRRMIAEVGIAPPDWYESTPLDYPQSLDLSWPLKPPTKGWNNQKNMGQYIWDIINPNPSRWRSGAKLIHHIMAQHKDDSALLQRDMKALGGMYFRLFQDYGRAAFWLRKAGAAKGTPEGVKVAECYWRLGSKKMAMDMLNARTLPFGAIKLLGDMGETQKAIQLAAAFARAGHPHEAYLLGADALRMAGEHTRAIAMYERVISAPGARNKDYEKRHVSRAKESIEAIRLFDRADVRNVRNGTYKATTTAYNGPLEVEVQVAQGRIESVKVLRHTEKQFYAALTDTPNQIIAKQSVKGIDATSGATITAQAIVNATAKAMAQGAK